MSVPRNGPGAGLRPATRSAALLAAVVLVSGTLLAAPPAPAAAGKGGAEATREQDPEAASVELKLPDLELLDQDGRRVRFESDVIGDRIAVVDVFFTTCGLVCPILSAILADLQDRLGDRLGTEVSLVSISVDPKTDIPSRLKEYATRYGARPGWVFLTGEQQDVDRVLRGIGAYAADFAGHPTMMLVGDGRTGSWTRFYGFPTPDQLMAKIDELRASRQARAGPPASAGGVR